VSTLDIPKKSSRSARARKISSPAIPQSVPKMPSKIVRKNSPISLDRSLKSPMSNTSEKDHHKPLDNNSDSPQSTIYKLKSLSREFESSSKRTSSNRASSKRASSKREKM